MCYWKVPVTLSWDQFASSCISAACSNGGSSCKIELEEDRLGCGDISYSQFLSIWQAQLYIRKKDLLHKHDLHVIDAT